MIYQPLRGTKLSSVQFKVGHGRFVSHIAFCGSRMLRGPANIPRPAGPGEAGGAGSAVTWKSMARGWESKSVESQMETSQSKQEETAKKRLTAEVAAALRKKETLLLARTHLQQQMQASQHPRHREMLQNALTDLEKQLADLGALDRAAGSH